MADTFPQQTRGHTPGYRCSECGELLFTAPRRCPHCGAVDSAVPLPARPAPQRPAMPDTDDLDPAAPEPAAAPPPRARDLPAPDRGQQDPLSQGLLSQDPLSRGALSRDLPAPGLPAADLPAPGRPAAALLPRATPAPAAPEPRVLHQSAPPAAPRVAAAAPPQEPRPVPPEHRRFARPGNAADEPVLPPQPGFFLKPAVPAPGAPETPAADPAGPAVPPPGAGGPGFPAAASLDAIGRHMGRSVAPFPAQDADDVLLPPDEPRPAASRRRGGLGATLLVGVLGIGALIGGWLWLTGRPAGHPVSVAGSPVSVAGSPVWQSVDIQGALGAGGQAVITADAPFRVRVDGTVYSITDAEGVVLPLAGARQVEVRAIGPHAGITITPAR